MLDEYRHADTAEAYDSMVRGLALPVDRTPQPKGDVVLPKGTVVVSADNHWTIRDDIFYERFPARLKERAPRVKQTPEGAFEWYVDGKPQIPPAAQRLFQAFERVPGAAEIGPRMSDLDVEGVEKELVFGNAVNMYLAYPDLEVREWVFRVYNEHLMDMNRLAPGRFYGVGLINYWDMEKTRQSIFEAKEIGLKTIQLPINPKGANGAVLNYCLPEMDPLWAAIEDSELPVCFHVGENHADGPGGEGVTVMTSFAGFRKNFGELVFGGILDRHPTIQAAFVEAEINWVPGALQTASMLYEAYRPMLTPLIHHHPRYYWEKNCYAVFTCDPVGMRQLDIVGADRVMWSHDYPHAESAYGWGWNSIKAVLDATTPDEARMILGGTAIDLFKLA